MNKTVMHTSVDQLCVKSYVLKIVTNLNFLTPLTLNFINYLYKPDHLS